MDPDANLREQREIVARMRDDETARTLDAFSELERLTDLVETLDEWLSTAGHLPREWES